MTLDDVAERFEEECKKKTKKSKRRSQQGTKVVRKKAGSKKKSEKSSKKTLEEAKDVDETDDTVADIIITADEDSCQVCGTKFDDDSEEAQETWIGCDNCWRWYHYTCVHLMIKPTEEQYWCCSKCRT